MQFVFGDNTSKYTMLYFDDKPDAAEKAQSLVQMSYSPNPDFDSVGFVPFGANNTRALFFKFQKDFKMKRNVYFLHGVYGDVEPEYFYGSNYVSGLFTEFLDQEKFDVLRDQVLAGEKCDVPYGFDKTLAATPYEQITIESADLHEILTKLYQRKNVVLVMDDDKFSQQRSLLVVKLIFRYLTPSLRKLCSYVTAVDDTGDMNFMLRIIPRCMLKLKEEHVDLDNRNPLYKDKTNFSSIALALMAMDDKERQEVFNLYEKLYYGRDSIYKKQNFERFYLCYTATGDDPESLKLCDELLTDYLDNPKREKEPEIPRFLKDALAERYASEATLDELVDWDPHKMENVGAFCDANVDALRKVYYLTDRKLTYFRNRINGRFVRSYLAKEMGDLRSAYKSIHSSAKAMTDVKPWEEVLLYIFIEMLKGVKGLLDCFYGVKEQVQQHTTEYLQQNCKKGANEPRAVMEYAMSKVMEDVVRASSVVTDIDEHLRRYIIEEIVTPHNAECNRVAREARDMRDKSQKNTIFTAFVYRMKLDGVQAGDSEDADAAEKMSIDLDSLDIDPLGLTVEDLNRVAEDEELAPQLVEEITDYVVNVCAARDRSDFNPNRNENLKLVKNLKLCFKVAQALCERGAVDYAVLYLLAYSPMLEATLNYILKRMSQLDELDRQGLMNLKTVVPAQLKKRRRIDNLDAEDVDNLAEKAQEVMDDKTASKPLKVMATMVCDWAANRPPILVRERKRNLIIAACAGVGALLLIGAIVLGIALGGDKDKDKDQQSDESPKATTVATDPQPCQHTYEENVTKEASCIEEGEKTLTCSLCGESETVAIAVVEHNYVDGTCSVCNQCETHGDESWRDATCTAPKTCQKCGMTEGDALGHDYKDDVCQRCGDGCDHTFGETEILTQPSCGDNTAGEAKVTCTKCQFSMVNEIPATHDWQDGKCSKCDAQQPTEE